MPHDPDPHLVGLREEKHHDQVRLGEVEGNEQVIAQIEQVVVTPGEEKDSVSGWVSEEIRLGVPTLAHVATSESVCSCS